jgi:ERCC4-type nuclease
VIVTSEGPIPTLAFPFLADQKWKVGATALVFQLRRFVIMEEVGPSAPSFVPVHVLIDHREKISGVHEHLAALPNVTVEFKELTAGDYWISDRLIVERKTMRDFAELIIDSRLFTQANQLAQRLERVVFLLEGGLSDWDGIKMRREALQGAIITLTLIYGFPLLRSVHAEESARLMIYAARQVQRMEAANPPFHGRKPKRKRTRQLRILQALPGIGPERAEQLLERFVTVEKVISATQQDLETIDGIGPKTASAIRSVLD